ncbi:unnamed protein product [Mycena citricolor]|uniref:Transposase n=1 Tax=Mycena citricolor TaxID=2018698 RepID=A0AAD2GZP8_9AGAR|nr:unnamed protein product [Mycena citricolor]
MSKHVSRPHHTLETRAKFIGAMLNEFNIKKHARQFDIPYSTAKKLWRKYQETGSVKDRPKQHPKLKVTPDMERAIEQTARDNRRMPFRDIGNQMDPPVSERTVGRVLDGVGMHRRVARHVPYFSEPTREKRLAWAERNSRNTARQWNRIVWSDECYVHLNGNQGRIFVTRTSEEADIEECLVPAFKQSSVRVMVWGCIAHGWKGPLVVLEYPGGQKGGMTADRYQKQILETVLFEALDSVKQMRGGRDQIRFQQDGASCHTAKSTCAWLKKHRVRVFDHPPTSPDVSPIEPVWHELKKRVRARDPLPTLFKTLKTAILEEWENMPISDIEKSPQLPPPSPGCTPAGVLLGTLRRSSEGT